MVPGPERSFSSQRAASHHGSSYLAEIAEMDTDTEFKIQTRFEKYAEFVALQNQALSLGISPEGKPQGSDEESNRQINLVRDMVNIVR